MPSKCIRKPTKPSALLLRSFFRRALAAACGDCSIQSESRDGSNDGWPCRTCFFDMTTRLGLTSQEAHAFWLIQLSLRDDGSRVSDLYTIRVEKSAAAREHELRVFLINAPRRFYQWLDTFKKER